jgi:hypothetical protein
MTLSLGARLGPYEILSPLGTGGMGQVYRDTRLGRDVALKTLPDSFTHAPERLARFRREAQMLASLNHPHIGAIYGLEEVNGQQVLVLEFVDGETLADRIARGPIPFEDTVVLATQIAEALDAAHEKGIIHRDLKPANIALTKEGAVKVLDFGLAKAADRSGAAQLDMPTLTSPALMTGQVVILGTAANVPICRISVVFSGASWGRDDSIVFAQAGGLGLFRVPAAGGEPVRIAAPDTSKGERNYLRPTVLPDGRSMLYTVALSGGQSRIVARRLDGGDAMTVVESGFGAEYLASGHLLYAQDQRLMAVPFDVATLQTTGSPVPVQEDVSTKILAGVANVVAAGDGTVVFISSGLNRGLRHIVWVDRRGTHTRALEEPREFPRYPRLSPDGARLAITTGPTAEGNVWVHDLSGASRLPSN